jgi:hypothetical protein
MSSHQAIEELQELFQPEAAHRRLVIIVLAMTDMLQESASLNQLRLFPTNVYPSISTTGPLNAVLPCVSNFSYVKGANISKGAVDDSSSRLDVSLICGCVGRE